MKKTMKTWSKTTIAMMKTLMMVLVAVAGAAAFAEKDAGP